MENILNQINSEIIIEKDYIVVPKKYTYCIDVGDYYEKVMECDVDMWSDEGNDENWVIAPYFIDVNDFAIMVKQRICINEKYLHNIGDSMSKRGLSNRLFDLENDDLNSMVVIKAEGRLHELSSSNIYKENGVIYISID